MTAKDLAFIKEAKSYSYSDWYKVSELAEKAETKEAYDELHHIACRLYHDEEYYAGML